MAGFDTLSLNTSAIMDWRRVQRPPGAAVAGSGLVAIGGRDTHIEGSALGVDISDGSYGSAKVKHRHKLVSRHQLYPAPQGSPISANLVVQ
jgi:hypothetical protein